MAINTNNPTYHALIDSDAFVGLLYEKDAHHKRATELFEELEKQKMILVTTNYIVAETATVLSNRQGQALARAFLKAVKRIPMIHINEDLHQQSLALFEKQTKRGTSVVDCSNVVVMRRFGIPQIFSFDKVYAKDFRQQVA
jgi:uncharacterized protein